MASDRDRYYVRRYVLHRLSRERPALRITGDALARSDSIAIITPYNVPDLEERRALIRLHLDIDS